MQDPGCSLLVTQIVCVSSSRAKGDDVSFIEVIEVVAPPSCSADENLLSVGSFVCVCVVCFCVWLVCFLCARELADGMVSSLHYLFKLV